MRFRHHFYSDPIPPISFRTISVVLGEVLVGVLTWLAVLGSRITVPQIASFLDVVPSLVEGVVLGSTSPLFSVDSIQNIDFSAPSLMAFFDGCRSCRRVFCGAQEAGRHLPRNSLQRTPLGPFSRVFERRFDRCSGSGCGPWGLSEGASDRVLS